jgi:type I restriction enzyme M protein
MITKDNLKDMVKSIGFTENKDVYSKFFKETDATLKVDFKKEELIYPKDKGFIVNERQTCNFKSNENFVVFECVHQLFKKGYKPEHIELEPRWKVGHGASGGRADILVKDNSLKSLLIIECKTEGKEHKDAWKETLQNGGQLFSYVKQVGSTQFVCLYSSDLIDNKIISYYKLISLIDNKKLLEELKEKNPLSFDEAKKLEAEDIYKAWRDTYHLDYATKGLFESDIQAYNIGKRNFSLVDLDTVSSKDIQGKYHEFATILRQHNVSGRENAFDKLVNLFLCKIVDETRNPEDLKFYWKGIAYDSYFELQDRLQLLYQSGMKVFLGENVTYIDNSAIDEAFRFFKNDPDATRDTIKKYFRQLKFFTNNDFAFIDVHNETLFYQNAGVLLKIVKMLQDIRLKTDEQNQFLGDMFEGFLDQGIKQSEGQFFTPMPIVKFILASLPLESIIKESERIPKVIDYACGAGHFLNEYALQIAPYVKKHKEINITEYYPEIIGIEKEYRLSKVAKVSAFMYGQDDIKIVYNDALIENPRQQDNGFKVRDNEYSVLVSNPPYSVKGFLETLNETDRNRFELIDTIDEKSFANNNSIEAFFIERAKQLLKPDGVAGIIAPSSILSKGSSKQTSKKQNVYVAIREILLKYFDMIAIAEFGSGTFGKTGTNTVTLFLRRRKENPAPADHYKNRVDAWFKGDTSKNNIFEDEYLIKKYCSHLEYHFEDYKTLLEGSPNENILNTDVFREYRKDFDNSAEIKNRKKQYAFKSLSQDEQQAELDKKFLEYLRNAESNKLYYFVMASQNLSEVVIVKSPTDNNAKKKFLGYEWSSAKGNEGIKYLGGEIITVKDIKADDEASLEEDDVRVLSNILNLNNIQTPLYDPEHLDNAEKINSIICANFNGKAVSIPEGLKEYVSTAELIDMLDFSRKEFNKAISLTPKKTIMIVTKWEIKKLSELVEIISGGTPNTNISEYWNGDIPWLIVSDFNKPSRFVYESEKKITELGLKNSNTNYLEIGDIIISARGTVGALAQLGVRATFNQSSYGLRAKNKNITSNNYLYYILVQQIHQFKLNAYGSKFDSITVRTFDDIKIPLPPLEVQKQIVQECEAIDKDFEKAAKELEEARKEIEHIVLNINAPNKKFGEVAIRVSESINPQEKSGNIKYIGLENIESHTGKLTGNINSSYSDIKSTKILFQKNDLLYGKLRPNLNKVLLAKFNGVCSTDILVFRFKNEFHSTYYSYYLLTTQFNNEVLREVVGQQLPRTSWNHIQSILVKIPSNGELKRIIPLIEKQENIIKKAKDVIDTIAERKQKVIKKYL